MPVRDCIDRQADTLTSMWNSRGTLFQRLFGTWEDILRADFDTDVAALLGKHHLCCDRQHQPAVFSCHTKTVRLQCCVQSVDILGSLDMSIH